MRKICMLAAICGLLFGIGIGMLILAHEVEEVRNEIIMHQAISQYEYLTVLED